MKSRRQSSGGAGEGSMSSGGGGCGGGGGKMERKEVEKNRRLHMKGLCLKLSSLIPQSLSSASASAATTNKSQDGVSVTQLDHLDNAAAYIRQLKDRIRRLSQRMEARRAAAIAISNSNSNGMSPAVSMPVVEVRWQEQEATVDVVLITRAGEAFKLHQVIAALEQEGAEVVNATFSVVGDKVFYTIHSQSQSQSQSESLAGGGATVQPQRLAHTLRHLLLHPSS